MNLIIRLLDWFKSAWFGLVPTAQVGGDYGLRYRPETPMAPPPGERITIEILSRSPFTRIPTVVLALDCEYIRTTVRGGVHEVSYLTTPAVYSGHYDIYVDGEWLGGFYVPGDAPPPPPVVLSPPPSPPPPSDRGRPRVQYERTYVLLPPGADAVWASAVVDGSWDDSRYTLGGSADDSAVGNLDYRRIIAVNPHLWPGDLTLEAFFERYYPGIVYEPITVDTPEQLERLLSLPEPTPPPPPPPLPSFPLRGVHDLAGAEWLLQEGLQGWCVESVDLNLDPRRIDGLERYRDAGIRVILRLNYSYAVDDGGMGTMPVPHQLAAFEAACVETMRLNPAAWGFVYCNEANNEREWPHGYNLTPTYYKDSFNRVYGQKPHEVRLLVGAADPTNPGWGDWRISWGEVLDGLDGCDGFALHAYTHGSDPALIWHDKRFGDEPLVGVHYDLRMLEDQQSVIPPRFAHLPQVVTESNHLTKLNSSKWGWDPGAGEWVREAYRYFASRDVIGVTLFRFSHTGWRFGDLPTILAALRELGTG